MGGHLTETLPQLLNGHQLIVLETINNEKDSLTYWLQRYWQTKVIGSPEGTMRAKHDDLLLFTNFFIAVIGSDAVDFWTPSVSKSFKAWLQKDSPKNPEREYEKAYAPTSVNRMLATLRHFARFVNQHRAFEAGSPFDGVRDLAVKSPEWNGIKDISLMRLRAALDQVTQLSIRKDQMPLRNRAVFTLATNSGLRASEMVGLDLDQYQGKYLKNVRGKGEQYDDVYLSVDVRDAFDVYIEQERGHALGPLFLTNRGNRLLRRQVDRFLKQVAAQANSRLPEDEKIQLSAHQLRHTSVKKVHDQRGELAAKRFSRHQSFAQLERYATQTTKEHEAMVDSLWDGS